MAVAVCDTVPVNALSLSRSLYLSVFLCGTLSRCAAFSASVFMWHYVRALLTMVEEPIMLLISVSLCSLKQSAAVQCVFTHLAYSSHTTSPLHLFSPSCLCLFLCYPYVVCLLFSPSCLPLFLCSCCCLCSGFSHFASSPLSLSLVFLDFYSAIV
jgi:hypothetical protein